MDRPAGGDTSNTPAKPDLTLRRLVDNGLGPALGRSPDWLRRPSIARVTRLGPEELARRLD